MRHSVLLSFLPALEVLSTGRHPYQDRVLAQSLNRNPFGSNVTKVGNC